MANTIRIIPMTKEHVIGWRALWRMNVGDALQKPVIDHTEKLLLDDHSGLFSLLAVDGDEVIGFLHGVVHPVAGSNNPVCYMQDLYIHPARRRQGLASKLIEALSAKGRADKWDRVYWLTDNTNKEARALYQHTQNVIPLDFTFHILPIGMLDKIGAQS